MSDCGCGSYDSYGDTGAYNSYCNADTPYPSISHESVPSLIDNLVNALYGAITKDVSSGKVVWNIPCDPSNAPANINNIPRNQGEGLLCYIIRALNIVGGYGFVTVDGTQTLTNKTLTAPVINNAPILATGSTTTRTLENRFADVINVKDFGATGNGTTDDTAAIQAAISTMGSSTGSLYFPEGTYKTTGIVIDTKSNFEVFGSFAKIISTNVNYYVMMIRNSSRFAITGLDLSHATQPARLNFSGIFLTGCSDFKITNNHVHNCTGGGILVDNFSTRGAIRSNTVYNTLADGIHVTGGSSVISVTGNATSNTGDDGIAVVAYRATGQTKGIAISGNVVKYSSSRGISCVGGIDVSITGNTISGTTYSGVLVAQEASYNTYGASNVAVSGNEINDVGAYGSPTSNYAGIQISGADTLYPIGNVVVSGNNISSCYWRMISVNGGVINSVSILSNSCVGPSTTAASGIEIANALFVAVIGNSVQYASTYGIYINSTVSNGHVASNVVYYPNQSNQTSISGIFVNPNSIPCFGNFSLSDPTKPSGTIGRLNGRTNDATNAGNFTANQIIAYAGTRGILSTVGHMLTTASWGFGIVSGTAVGTDTIDVIFARSAAGVGVIKNASGARGKIELANANINSLATYENDAAAGAGGLTSGELYKTSTGAMMVKL